MNFVLYLHLHHRRRLRGLSVFDAGLELFDSSGDRARLIHAAETRYLPVQRLLLEAISRFQDRLRLRIWLSGLTLELAEEACPPLIDSWSRLTETGCVDWLPESYYHSLAFLYSPAEFQEQVELHARRIRQTFGRDPTHHSRVPAPPGQSPAMPVRRTAEHGGAGPLTTNSSAGGSPDDDAVHVPLHDGVTPTEIEALLNGFAERGVEPHGSHSPVTTNHSPLTPYSSFGWVAARSDLSPWLGNPLASGALHALFDAEKRVKAPGNAGRLHLWRSLQDSNLFSAMVRKLDSESEPIGATEPICCPYEAYIKLMTALDLTLKTAETRI